MVANPANGGSCGAWHSGRLYRAAARKRQSKTCVPFCRSFCRSLLPSTLQEFLPLTHFPEFGSRILADAANCHIVVTENDPGQAGFCSISRESFFPSSNIINRDYTIVVSCC